ncbi:MAG: hydroxyacid dehydrogenase [Elioraea sp.]|nr:hydroxyacid dehydrogenase [Elioraea sp.]
MALIVLERPLHPAGRSILDSAPGVTVAVASDPADFAARAREAEAILLWLTRVDRAFLDACPRLKVVARYGVGFDTVDVAACTERGLPVAVTNGANDLGVAEHAMALLLGVARRLTEYDAMVRRGEWRSTDGPAIGELAGRSVLVIGYGRIGTRVARLCAAFGMRVMVHDPAFPTPRIAADGHLPAPDWRAALAEADVVTLHCPLNDTTRHLIDADAFARMKPGVWLINTARGPVVDETALVAALRSGKVAAAGLDVLSVEPARPDNPLLTMPNVILTPHAAASARETLARMAERAARNILDALAGRIDPGFLVNPEVVQHGR